MGIFSEEELREADDEGRAVGGSGLSTVEEEKAGQACAPLASPSITSTASSTSPLLQTEGGKVCKETVLMKKQKKRGNEATVDSREDLDEFEDEVLEGYSEQPSEVEDLRNEVLTFRTNCPDCNAPAQTNMKVTSKFF